MKICFFFFSALPTHHHIRKTWLRHCPANPVAPTRQVFKGTVPLYSFAPPPLVMLYHVRNTTSGSNPPRVRLINARTCGEIPLGRGTSRRARRPDILLNTIRVVARTLWGFRRNPERFIEDETTTGQALNAENYAQAVINIHLRVPSPARGTTKTHG